MGDKKNIPANSFSATHVSYAQTGHFSKIVTDYLSQNDLLKNFYRHPADLQGIKDAIAERKNFTTNRALLAAALERQYEGVQTSDKTRDNIRLIGNENTFTVCTAHQPNIFTGHLYFIYKIIHAIKLADTLCNELPGNHFVPVFYMGSEDADLDELGHVFLNGEKYEWDTKQTGAVGRMKVDDALPGIIEKISGQISVEPYGDEIIQLIKDCYMKGRTIQDATFHFINTLFSEYGLIVLIPDDAALKRTMTAIFEEDIFNNTSSKIVNKTSQQLSQNYKVQAHPREINLFYLENDLRERIIKTDPKSSAPADGFRIQNSGIKFTDAELRNELKDHPERFSPNVILRALYQETILPDVAFIGGGGELAYWLELNDLFHHYRIPYPVLILRNSFVIIPAKLNRLLQKLAIAKEDIFKESSGLMSEIIKKNSDHNLGLQNEKQQVTSVYTEIKQHVNGVDPTLAKHADALLANALKKLEKLETKILKAERKRFEAEARQVQKIKSGLFPNNSLQERVDNLLPYYAKWGKNFLNTLYDNSLSLEHEMTIISEESG